MKDMVKRASAGAVLGGSLLFTAGLGIASAQPPFVVQDGLVNLSIGDISVLEDVNVAAAAQIAAAVCGVEVGPVNVLAESVDLDGGQQTVCTNNLGPIDIQQNGPGQSENAPGQQRG